MKLFQLLSMAGWVLGCSYTRFKHRELERELFRKAQEDMEIECIKNPGKITKIVMYSLWKKRNF